MNRLLLLLLVPALLWAGLRPAAAQNGIWNRALPGATAPFNQHRLMAVDAAGNTYVAGTYSGRLIMGADTLREVDTTQNRPGQDLFVAKYNAAGQIAWVHRVGGLGGDTLWGLARDGFGNLFLAGSSYKGLTIGAQSLAQSACWLAKLDGNGNGQWLRPLFVSNSHEPMISVITADQSGRCYVAANSPHLDSISTYSVQVAGFVSAVAQFDGNGNVLGVQEYTAGRLRIYDMTLSPTDDLFCTGVYWNTGFFGPPTLLTLLGGDSASVFLTRITTAPNFQTQWARGGRPRPGTGSIILGSALAADAGNNCYLGGWTTAGLNVNTPGGNNLSHSRAGIYIMKFDAFGTPQWVVGEDDNSGTAYPLNMTFDAGGNLCTAGYYSNYADPLQFGSFTLGNSSLHGMRPFIVSHTPSGSVQWARDGEINTEYQNIWTNGLGADAQGNLYLYGNQYNPVTNNRFCSLSFDNQVAFGTGAFLARFDQGAQVTGIVFFDQNANGLRDAGEPPFPAPVIITETARSLFSTSSPDSGTYHALLPTGSYSLMLTPPPAYFTVSAPATGVHAGLLATPGQVDTGRDFGLAPTANRIDLRVTLTAYTPARVGQPLRYRARVENLGTTIIPGAQVTVTLDTAAQIIGGIPAASGQSGQTLTWNFGQLLPFGKLDFDAVFSLPINLPMGLPMVSTATVSPLAGDLTPANNADTVRQNIVGSFDPNDISVNYTRLTPQQVAAGTALDYVIRFQNLGTDTAFAVTILDTLPASLLQLGTVQLVAQSHNCQWSLSGRGELRITFPGIRLPHRAVDAMRSLGYVRFQVIPRASLAPGDLIPNKAHITFDFNAALSTNEVTTLVQNTNGLVAEPGVLPLSLYPNPANSTARVTLTTDVATPGAAQVLITDLVGRSIRQEKTVATTGEWHYHLSTADLKPGIYLVRLALPGGMTASRKLVVR